jgi:hypothetical protein
MKVVRLTLSMGILGLLSWSDAAQAECPNAYTPQQITADLGTMTRALRDLDEVTFRSTGAQMEALLPCSRKKFPIPVYANLYRYIGAYHYLNNDYQTAGQWFRLSLELDPNFEWDINDLEPGHALRVHFDAQRQTAAVDPEPIPGFELNVPAGSALILDGRPLSEPAATMARPHLFQVISSDDGSVRQSFLIVGNQIPEAFLKPEAAAPVSEPVSGREGRRSGRGGEAVGEEVIDGFRVVTVQRVRPPSKTPMMLAGGAGLLVGGGLYALSYRTHQDFAAATTTNDLLRYQSLTNSLVVASGAMIAVGVGVGYAGVMMGAEPGVFVGGRF